MYKIIVTEHSDLRGKPLKMGPVELDIYSSSNTEAIMRGLIHEGFTVTIREFHEKKTVSRQSPEPIESRDPADEAPQYIGADIAMESR